MATITKVVHCKICNASTDHVQGTFKCKEIQGELFHLDTSVSDSLRKVSEGFRDYVREESGEMMDSQSPAEYVESVEGGLNFGELFAPTVRSLKCEDCGHLIRISRLP